MTSRITAQSHGRLATDQIGVELHGLESSQTFALDCHPFAVFQILDKGFKFAFRLLEGCFVGVAQIDAEVGGPR